VAREWLRIDKATSCVRDLKRCMYGSNTARPVLLPRMCFSRAWIWKIPRWLNWALIPYAGISRVPPEEYVASLAFCTIEQNVCDSIRMDSAV